MKLIIDIPKEVVVAIQNGEDYRYDIHTAIAQGMPYEDRPQGEWIGGEIGHCSICGSEGCASDIWNGCKDGMYCPNCGADMRVKGGKQ